ncbi:uncharacterized protein LOC127285803 [Leptopilina boulardi]|uniref:uncharacterized protein LOC127285803 n=1 Tax=Leptopilina boulardi TaxID=63433 RepID=UPI0021F6478D|nr:uncharacterized protein LOC127285803 [Leptopilina boulardi]
MVKTTLSSNLAKAIKRREKILLGNKALLAFMYLDAKYLPFLSEENCKIAKQVLKKVWNKISNNDESVSSSISIETLDEDMDRNNSELMEEECDDLLEIERKK